MGTVIKYIVSRYFKLKKMWYKGHFQNEVEIKGAEKVCE